ncbi:hypothetical protein wVul_0295 [Wolbachia endosymbiont of Armadillidium vulgare str. wVulC]|nr:hypothetical protein wVul_0295 [Wolbachia endosymbiont of Armadillidium vulgare str. wVulC]
MAQPPTAINVSNSVHGFLRSCVSRCMYNILAKWQKRSFIWLKAKF